MWRGHTPVGFAARGHFRPFRAANCAAGASYPHDDDDDDDGFIIPTELKGKSSPITTRVLETLG